MKKQEVMMPTAFNVARIGLLSAIVLVSAGAPSRAQSPGPEVVVYKSATCGCCRNWVEHMRAHGFAMTTHDVDNINQVKAEHRVPSEAASCHTAVVDGYVVEGHVPADAVQRLLRERPDVLGIAVPGMPIGSPGMEMNGRQDSYSIVTFDDKGQVRLFESR
jgi:hypothetical protein